MGNRVNQTIKYRMLRRWARDGFITKNSHARRILPDVTQIIFGQATSLGGLQVVLGLTATTAKSESRSTAVNGFDLFGYLIALDGSNHLNPAEFDFEWSSVLSKNEFEEWCDYVYDTAIYHFFSVFGSAEACAKIVKSGALKRMRVHTTPQYRESLGVVSQKSEGWSFISGSGDLDPTGILQALSHS